MQRKEFLKHACGLGMCSCTVAALFASAHRASAEEPAAPAEDKRLKFARQRYATLIGALAQHTDPATTSAVLEDVGRACASEVPFLAKFAGDIDGFLNEIRQQWHAEAAYDAEHGVVDLAFPPADDCFCPLLSKASSPALACTCSLGWQKHAFETVLNRPVTVTLRESVLRGDRRCAFHVEAT